MTKDEKRQRLLKIFDILLSSFGRRNWWPGDTPLEVMVGAILTQNTSWKNVERAITNLKDQGLLEVDALYRIDEKALAEIIKPAGYYNIKSNRLKNFIKVIHDKYGSTIDNLSKYDTKSLKDILLDIKGIGEETADSILLYALNRPIFVVDAYTKRFLKNHDLYNGNGNYADIQRFFIDHLPEDTALYNEYHALLVYLGQHFCKKIPKCKGCPLETEGSSS
jgi:endonuclease-3 related protein